MHLTGLRGHIDGANVWRATGEAGAPVAVAKTSIPDTPPTTLIRERLHDLLDAAVFNTQATSPVTVVCAPAGSGKTTLLASWARRWSPRHAAGVAWLSVDSEDNDSSLLWLGILQALQCSGAWPEQSPLDTLRPPSGGSYAVFVNALVAAFEPLSRPVVLIVDNVHEVQSNDTVRTLNLLLRRLPASLRVVLATRYPPPLILPRLKLEGRLREIVPAELAFSADEARVLYAKEGITVPETSLGVLMERTEGWVAGLRMAAMSAADTGHLDDVAAEFSGADRMIADYLLREVVGQQPDDVQQFMLATSVCRTFNADLAARLSGRENTGQIIDGLERTGVLVGVHDRAERWFRYHPLLRGCLRAELERRRFSALRSQHRVAAGWLLASGDSLRAMEHSISAGDDELAARLLARSGLAQILKGQSEALWRIIGGTPARVINRPSVALVAAATALDLGDLASADRMLWRIDNAVHPLRTQRLRALHATVRLHRARLRGEVDAALQALSTTHAGRTGDVDLDLLAVFNRGVARAWAGRHKAAEADLRRALRVADGEQHAAMALECRAHLAAMAAAAGDLTGVDRQAETAIAIARPSGLAMSPRSSYVYSMLGFAAHQRLQNERARRLAALAMNLMPDSVDPTIELCAQTLQAMITFDTAENPHDVVATLRNRWQRLSGKAVSPALVAYAAPAQQRMALRVGENAWAKEVLDRVEQFQFPCGEQALTHAILQVHKGKNTSPRRLLLPVLTGRIRTIVPSTLIEAWLLEAHLADGAGENNRAHDALCEALTLAAPQNALRPFHDARTSVRGLLARGAGRFGRLEVFATTVRQVLPVGVPDLSDGLTEREQALLAELPSMRTTEEIAQVLFVSVNTVKTHLRGIYRKLGVRHRRDAISVARERGLL